MIARLAVVLSVFVGVMGCGDADAPDAGPHEDAGVDGGGVDGGGLDATAALDAALVPDASSELDASPLDAGASLVAGTIVPLYTYPSDATWTLLAAAARAHPTVRVVAVINPNSGPTATADAAYTSGIASLQAAGVIVVAYVATGYGARATGDVATDVDLYAAQYPSLDGIFFDEAAIYEAGHEANYGAEAAHARAAGLAFLVANPGTAPIDSYAGLFDVALVYESAGAPTEASLARFAATRSHAGIIPYAVAALDASYVASIRADVEYVFITDDDLPNPWDTLPPYFEALLLALE